MKKNFLGRGRSGVCLGDVFAAQLAQASRAALERPRHLKAAGQWERLQRVADALEANLADPEDFRVCQSLADSGEGVHPLVEGMYEYLGVR